jgi:penicillin-binding protein 2
MARAFDIHRMVTRRAMVFGSVQAVAGVALLSRLYYLQFVKGEEFVTEAEGNRIKVQLIIPPRGLITDRKGVAMAINQINFRLMLETENRKQAKATLRVLGALIGMSKRVMDELDVTIGRNRSGMPILVKEHLAWEEMAKVEYHMPELAGAFIEEGQWRHYPFADHASHLIGYVGKVAEGEVKDNQPLLKQPDMRIGKSGIEQRYEEKLVGVAGTRQMEVNVVGAAVRELKKQPAVPGEELKLTIDSALQEYCVARLGQESGAIVVLDIEKGDVLALASVPSFDPNEFSKGISSDYWKQLTSNPKVPLMNKALAGQYPPGSTFKMLTGLAGLESGKVAPNKTVYCPGYFMLGNKRFGCWKVEGHGSMTMEEALAESCDTFFYTCGRDAGIEAMADIGEMFGMGELSGLGLSGERRGIMPSPAWKRKARNQPWNPGETINTAIGQGDVLTTPMQLAIMVARLASGRKIFPRMLLSEPVRDEGPLDIDPDHRAMILDGMSRVLNSPHGTAYASGIREPGYEFGGKTGTAQVKHLTQHGQNQNELPWELRHHALFVAFAPVDKPKYACGLIIEHGGGGASAAAPVARDVMRLVQGLQPIPPKVPV